MLIVSHDREFLDRTTTRTIFLRKDGAHAFKAPFAVAREELLQNDATAASARALEEREIARLEKVAARYKAWGVLNDELPQEAEGDRKAHRAHRGQRDGGVHGARTASSN